MPSFIQIWLRLRRAAPVAAFGLALAVSGGPPPVEPMEIGRTPQFFVDDHVVDNRWALKQKIEAVTRAFHPPAKHPRNPLIAGQGGYATVVREADSGRFKLWYQTHAFGSPDADDERTEYGVAYAESPDGLQWTLPKLGLVHWQGSRDNNLVWRGPLQSRASGPQVLDLPESERRGFRYVLTYRTGGAKKGLNGIRVIGSQDGVHWDEKSDTLVNPLPSDTVNSIVYDRDRREFVMFCRAKDRYRTFQGDLIDTGESRRIARLSSPQLWGEWTGSPQAILLPDELDARERFNAFYGMPAKHHAGIYWGALLCFRFNDHIRTELAFSRDGYRFDRLPDRPRLVDVGPDGAWDDGMAFASMDWVEVGDEWWIYYSGWDGDHGGKDRKPGIGLATLKRERLVSLRGPRGGGVVATRQIRWPGGDLQVNANASKGELTVRVSGERRQAIPGFNHDNCRAFRGDDTRHTVQWQGRSLNELKGQVVRLEFLLRDADLFTFVASP
jgi:hypothetical protein